MEQRGHCACYGSPYVHGNKWLAPEGDRKAGSHVIQTARCGQDAACKTQAHDFLTAVSWVAVQFMVVVQLYVLPATSSANVHDCLLEAVRALQPTQEDAFQQVIKCALDTDHAHQANSRA